MAGVGKNNQSSSIRGIASSDGSIFLLSDRLGSLNFNGFIPRSSTPIYASDLTVGQTIFNSDPLLQNNSFFITKIDAESVVVDSVDEQKYFLYFLGEENLQEQYTYGAENEDGSFSQDHLFSSYRDDISNISVGTDGWMITNQGNAVFSNVFVRGTIEATSGKIDGILSVGESLNGEPLVTIGKNIFESTSFEGSSSEHSGIFLDKHNYFMGYDDIQSTPILSVVAENSTSNVTLRKAVFTLASHTLSVRDKVSISGFTEDKFLELEDTFSIAEVTQNTFTVYYKNEIAGTTNPIAVSLKADSFGLDNISTITELNLSNVVSTENTSTLKIYISKEYTGNFEEGFPITISSFTSPVFAQSSNYLVDSIVVTAGEDDPDYLLTSCLRVTAGTYTTGLGQINSSLKNYKFKVGNDTNSMSFNSFTGALSVTGTINADSGNFTNSVTIGKQNISYSIYNKKLLSNVATLTTSTFHNFVIGDSVVVSGVDATFNGTYTVTGVPTLESFTYAKTASNVVSTAVSPLGTAAIGEAENGTLNVGYGTNKITIDGTGTDTTSAIFSGAGNYGNSDTGFFMDASGRFSLKDKLTFTGGNLTVSGTVNASAGYFQTGYIGGTNSGWQITTNTIQSVGGTNKITLLNGSVPKIYIGTGTHGNANTPFYADGDSKFSIGNRIVWDPDGTGTLTIDGVLRGFVNDTTPITANPGNTMGFGLFSGDAAGVGLKINNNNYWFADAGNPRIKVGSATNFLSYQASSDILEVTGTINAESGTIGEGVPWTISNGKISAGESSTFIGLQTTLLDSIPQDFVLDIDSILIDSEGGGLSSIYIVANNLPSGTLVGLNGRVQLSFTSAITLAVNTDETKLTNYSWTVNVIEENSYSLSGGNAVVGSALPAGKVMLIIYGEEHGETFVDEYATFTGSEQITVSTVSADSVGIWVGDPSFPDAPFSVNSNGLLTASSGKIGGFLFKSLAQTPAGSFVSDTASFVEGLYNPPYEVLLSPTDGIVLNVNSSLNDAAAYFSTKNATAYPTTPEEYRELLKSTGFTIVDNTGAASNVTVNPYMGIRSESISALNIAKNGSFEYKVGNNAYGYSGAGWVAETGLTLSSLSTTTAGYSFPALPYGQQFVGKLAWTSTVSTFLKTTFLVDTDGSNESYPSPVDPTSHLSVGSNGLSASFAVYNSQPSGLFGTNHYVAAYPLADIKVTFTDNLGATQTIPAFANTDIKISDMLKNLYSANATVNFENGYLYLSAPYTDSQLSFAVTATSGIVITDGVGDGSATLTIGAHPFYADQQVYLYAGSVDLGDTETFIITSVTATEIVVDDSSYNITGVDTIKTNEVYVFSSSATRGKNGLSFDIDPIDYDTANQALPFTLHLPGYYYGVTFDLTTSYTATFTRGYNDTLAIPVTTSVNLQDVVNEGLFTATQTSLTSTATSLTLPPDIPGIGEYTLYRDYDSQDSYLDVDRTPSETTITLAGNYTTQFTNQSFAKIGGFIDLIDQEYANEFIKINAVPSYSAGSDVTTLTVLRGQLGSTALYLTSYVDLLYSIERINITNLSATTANYYNFDKALFDYVGGTIVPVIGSKISNSSIAFDELVISDSSIPYFDGDTGGGSVWGVDASQPAIWSYKPAAVIAQLGGNPLVIGNSPGLQLIKQVSYEPYTYLLENPSVFVEEWDSDLTQSALVLTGGKFSIDAKEPRIELISGTSATNNAMVNIDGSKVKFMESHSTAIDANATNGLVIRPWKGTDTRYLSIAPQTFTGESYGILFDKFSTFISSYSDGITSGSTYLRGPNNSQTAQIQATTDTVSISNLVTSDTNTAYYSSNSNISIPASTAQYQTTVSGVAVSGVVFKAPRSGSVMVHVSASVGVYDGESYCVTEVRTGSLVTGTGGTIVLAAGEGTGIYVNGAVSGNLATSTGASFYRLTGLTPGTNYQVYFKYANSDTLAITIYNRKIMVVPEL